MPIILSENDVLLGRGRALMAHPGNGRMRTLAIAQKQAFQAAKKRADKRGIAHDIVDEIVRSGGRFLTEDPAHANDSTSLSSRVWVEVDRDKAVAKVMHKLREKDKDKEKGAKAPSVAAAAAKDEPAPSVAAAAAAKDEPAPYLAANYSQDMMVMSGNIVVGSSAISTDNAGISMDNAGALLGAASSAFPLDHDVGNSNNNLNNFLDEPVGSSTNMKSRHSTAEDPKTMDDQAVGHLAAHATAVGKSDDDEHAMEFISIRDWVKIARMLPSKEAYLSKGVELAWRIAKHIAHLIENETDVRMQDIAPENVMIIVDRPLPIGSPCPSILEVKFLAEALDASTEPLLSLASSQPLLEREACASLGKVLMEIFNTGEPGGGSAQRERAGDGMPPPPKRRALFLTRNNLVLSMDLPMSISRLMTDLLDAANEQCPKTALTSLEEALWEMGMMKTDPESFLFDRTNPEKALEHFHNTDKCLFGRHKELIALANATETISSFVRANNNEASGQEENILCETLLLSGYAGSGKSSLLKTLIHACNQDEWFVLNCKFDKEAPPIMAFAKSFDEFFVQWGRLDGGSSFDPPALMKEAYDKVCSSIFLAVDREGFSTLGELVPSLFQVFPLMSCKRSSSNMDKPGCAQKRRLHLLSVLFASLLSAGRPVLFALDDLQWSEPAVMECLAELVAPDIWKKTGRRGLLVCGAYRSNEVEEEDDLIETFNTIEHRASVTRLDIAELEPADVTKLLSAKLCLPWRYTQEMADLVHSKTRGNPFFISQFLRTIVSNKMLEFSVRHRRWIWDVDVVDMQMISDGSLATYNLS